MVLAFIICIFIVVIISVTMYYVLGKSTKIHAISKEILYSFEQDNINPTVTDLVKFSKSNKKVNYVIDK